MTVGQIRGTTNLDDIAAVLAVLAVLRGNTQNAADRAGVARWRAQRQAVLTKSYSSPGDGLRRTRSSIRRTHTEPEGTQMSDRAEDVREIVQRGLWFEDFQDGVIYRHRPGRTVTEADNVLFTTLTMNTQSLHLDAAWSEQQPFGQRLVNSMFTLATTVGLSVAQLTEGTIVANLGFSEVTFPKPMFHGDTLYAETALLSKRVSASRNGEGIVTLQHTGRNQHGDVVVQAVRATLVRKRP